MDFVDSPSSPSDSTRRSSKISDSSSNKSKDIFQSRKNSFLRSLKAALQNISNDQLIAQMFEDPNSTLYIPGRVVEIIQETLEDDRENLIMSLLQQNNEFKVDPIEFEHFVKTSKNIINSLSIELEKTKRFINYTFKREFVNNEIENARMQVNAFVTAALSGRYISNMNSESLQKQVNFISKKFFEIDLPNLRTKYENEIKIHVENEAQQQKMIASLTRQNEKLTKDSNFLAEKLNKKEKENELLKNKLNSLQEVQKQVSVAKNQIKTMQKEVDKKNKAIDFYVSEKSNEDSTSLNYSRLQSSYSLLKKKYEETEAENVKLRETITKKSLSQKENDHINTINQANLQMLKLKNASIPQLENELQKSLRHAKSLEITNIEIARRLDRSLKENRDLYKTIDQLRDEISGATTDRTNKAELRSEIELLNEELAAAKKQISDLDSNVFELSQYNQKLKREIDSKSSSLDQSMLDFSSQKSKFQNSLAESETKVSFLTSKLKEYESSIHFNMKQLRQKELQINELIQSKHEIEELANQLKMKLESRETEFQQASISCEQSSEAYLYAQAELKQKESIINKLLQADEISKQQKEQMSDKIEENNLTIQKLNGSIHELATEKDKMQTKIDERENKIDELNGKIKETDNKLIEKENLMSKLNSSNQSLRKTIKKLEINKNNNEQTISSLREKVAQDEKKINKHEESIQFLKSEIQKLQNEKKDLQKKISDDNIAFEARLNQTEKEKVLLTKKQTEAELKLNSSLEECKSLTEKLEKSLKDFDNLTKESAKNQKEASQTQANLNEKIEQLKQNNATLLGKFDNLLQQANEVVKIKRIHDIPGVLKKLKEKYDQLLIDDSKSRKILKISTEFESVPDTIQKIKDDRIRLLKFESKIRKTVGNFDSDFILQTITDCIELKNVVSTLFKQQTTPSEYHEIIQNTFLRLQQYEEREILLNSLFASKNKSINNEVTINDDESSVSNSGLNEEIKNIDNNSTINKELPTYVSTMQTMYRDSHHIIKKLCRLFEIRNQEEIPTRVSILLTQIQELKSILKIPSDADSTISSSSTNSPNKKERVNYEASVSKAAADMVDQLKEAQTELRTIHNLFEPSNDIFNFSNENENDADLPVNKKIENMQNENKKLRYILNSASQVISQKETTIEVDQSEDESSLDLSSSLTKSPKKATNNNSLNKSKSSTKKSLIASPLRTSVYLASPLSRQPIDADFILKCQQMKQKIELLENQQKDIERVLPNIPNNFSRIRSLDETDNTNSNLVLIGSLPDRVKQMTNRYETYYNQVNECQKIFKDANKSYVSINGNLPNAVSMILTRIDEFERQERMIKTILSESSAFTFSGNIQETISELIQKNLDLTLTFQQLNGIVFASKDDVKDDLVITVGRIVKERLEYQKMIDEYTEILSGKNISQKITLLLQNDSFLTKLKQLLECETNDDLFTIVKNNRVLLKKISALIPTSLNNNTSSKSPRSKSRSKGGSKSDLLIIDESALLEKMSHFNELFDFRREIFDRFNSSVQSVQPSDSLNSSIELTSDSDSDNSLIASTHRKKINLRKSQNQTQKAPDSRNQFETDQELFTYIDDLFNEVHVNSKLKNELEAILPRSVEGSITEKVNQIVKQCLLYQRQYSTLKKLIPSEFHGSLSSKIEQLMMLLKKYQNQQTELNKIVNERSFSATETDTESVTDNDSVQLNESNQLVLKNDDSLVADVSQIKRKLDDVNKDLYVINQIVPEEFVAGSERERVILLVEEFNKQKLIIQSISSSLDKNTSSLVNSKSNTIEKEVEKAVSKNEDLLNEKIEALKLLDSTQSNQELLPLLKKTIQEKKESQAIITQLRKSFNCTDKEVIEKAQQLKKDSLLLRNICQEMSQTSESKLIKKLKELNENTRVLNVIESTIPEDLVPYNDTNSKAKNEIDMNSSRLNLLQAKIALLIESYKEKHDTINKLNLNGNLSDSVSQLMIEKEELVQALSAIQNVLSKSSIIDENADSNNDSIGSKQMIVSQVTNLVNSLQQTNSLIAQMNEKLGDLPGDINTKLNEVLRQNSVLQKMQSDLLSILPENLSGSLIERVSQLCSEFANLENQQVAISRNIPIEFSSTENGQSVCQKVDSLQQDYSVQRKAIQRIQKMLLQNQYLHRNCSTIESVADCVEEILNQNSSLIQLQKNINIKFGIFGTNKFAIENDNNESDNDTVTQLMTSIDETFNTIDQLKAENLELKENMNELQEIANHSNLTEFVKKSLKDQKTIKKIVDLLSQNNKNSNTKNNNAFSLVQETVFELDKLNQEQKEIVSILSDFNENQNSKKNKLTLNEDSPATQISILIKSLNEQEQLLNDIKQQIPKEIKGESTFLRFKNLLKKYNDQKDVINKASSHLDTGSKLELELIEEEEEENENIENSNNNNNTKSDDDKDSKALIHQIQLLTKSNQKLLKERETIIDSLPASFKQFEYPDSVLNLSSELQKSESFLSSISNSFKEAEDAKPSSPKPSKKSPQVYEKYQFIGINVFASLPSQVELALEERNDLLKMKSRLTQQLQNEDVFEEVDRLMNLDSQLKFVNEKIPKIFEGNGIEKRIQTLVNDFQRKSSLIDKLDDTLPGSGDMVKRIQSLRDESEVAKRIISQLEHIMANELFEGKTLLEKVSNMAKRYQSINNSLNATRNKSIDISEEVMKLSLMNKKNKEKINNISNVLSSNNLLEIDENENYILEDRVEEICEELIKLREQLQFIDSEASSSATMKKVIKQKSIVNLPSNNDAASRKVGLLVQMNNQLEQRINSISDLLNNHFSEERISNDSSNNLSIEEQINFIIKENYSLKSQVNSIEDVMSKVKGNDIFDKMNQIQVELKRSKERIRNISSLIPDEFNASTIESNLEDLIKSYQSNNTYLNNIDQIVPDEESNIINNVQNSPSSSLKSNKIFMRNKFNENIQSKVSKVVQQNQEMKALLDKVNKAFPSPLKDQKDVIERISSLIQQKENQFEILNSAEKILNAHLKRENNDNLNDNSFKSIPENISNLVNENETLKSTLDEINNSIPNKLSSNKNTNSKNQEYLADVNSMVQNYNQQKNRILQIDQLLHIKNEFIPKKRENEDDQIEDINSKSIEERITFLFNQLKASQDECKKIKKAIPSSSKDDDEISPIERLNLILENKEKMTVFASHLANSIPEEFREKTGQNMVISDNSNFLSIERMMTNFVSDYGKQKSLIDDVQRSILESKQKDSNDDIEQGMIGHIQAIYEENSKANEIIPAEFKTQNGLIQNLTKFVKTYNSIKSSFSSEENEDILTVVGSYVEKHQQMSEVLETVKSTISSSIERSNNESEDVTLDSNNLNETLQKLLNERQENNELLYRLAKLIPSQFSDSNIEKSLSAFNKAFLKESNKPSQISPDSSEPLTDQAQKLKSDKEYLYEILDAIQKEIPEEIKSENRKESQNDEEEEEENEEKSLLLIHKDVELLASKYQLLSSEVNQIIEKMPSDITSLHQSNIVDQFSMLVEKKEKLDRIENMLSESEDEGVEQKIIQLLNNSKDSSMAETNKKVEFSIENNEEEEVSQKSEKVTVKHEEEEEVEKNHLSDDQDDIKLDEIANIINDYDDDENENQNEQKNESENEETDVKIDHDDEEKFNQKENNVFEEEEEENQVEIQNNENDFHIETHNSENEDENLLDADNNNDEFNNQNLIESENNMEEDIDGNDFEITENDHKEEED